MGTTDETDETDTSRDTSRDTDPGRGRAARVARVVTEVFTPAVQLVVLLAAVGAASTANRLEGVGWGLLAAMFTAVLPYGVILLWVRRGVLGDHHVRNREERLKPFGVGLGLLVTGLVILAVAGAPRQVVALDVAMLVGLLVTTAVTAWWKVSVHASVAAGTATILTLAFGAVALVAWPLVAAIGWSRVVLREHTTRQVLVGVPMGILTAGPVFALLRG